MPATVTSQPGLLRLLGFLLALLFLAGPGLAQQSETTVTIEVDRAALLDLTDNFRTAAEFYKTTADVAHVKMPGEVDLFSKVYDVVRALQSDLDRHTTDPLNAIVSSTALEQLAGITIDIASHDAPGLSDLAIGTKRLLATHDWQDPDTVARLLDAANRAAWYEVGFLASGFNPEAGKLFAEVGGFAAGFVRDRTAGWFAEQSMRANGTFDTIAAQFVTAQQSALAHGKPAVSIESFFAKDHDLVRSIPADIRARADAQFGIRPQPIPPDPTPFITITTRTTESYREVCSSGYCARGPIPPAAPTPGGVLINSRPVQTGRPPAGLGAGILNACNGAAACSLR